MMSRGQNLIEYTILIMVVAAAFLAMSVYVRRAVNAQLHNMEVEVNPPLITIE
jgi:Flp pilus assembly pilin Flp